MKKHLKKPTSWALALLLCMLFIPPALAAPSVVLDGQKLSFDVPPTIENGRTLVPMRAIFEALGAKVEWNQDYHTATATKTGNRIILTINKNIGFFNGKEVPLDVPARSIDNRTMVPLRFVSEYLGTDIIWNNDIQTILINSKAHQPENKVGGISFEKIISSSQNQEGRCVRQTRNGGYIVAASSIGGNGVLIKTNSSGVVEWSQNFDDEEYYQIQSIKCTSDDGYIVTGSIRVNKITAGLLMKLNTSGEVEWKKSYGDVGFQNSSELQQTMDGGYILAGYSYNNGGCVMKTDSRGVVVWKVNIGKTTIDWCGNILEVASGYIVAGNTFDLDANNDAHAFMVKLDTNGYPMWEKIFEDQDYATPTSLHQASNKGYFILLFNHVLLKTDETGNIEWSKNIAGVESTYSGQPTRDGGYIVAGWTDSGPGLATGSLIKLDNDGNKVWEQMIGSELPEFFQSIQETFDGGFIMTGSAAREQLNNVYLVKTNTNGNIYYE